MPDMEHLFISDVHLGAFSSEKEKEVEQRLISLIDYAILKEARLYILGDLFDYWMEYPKKAFTPELGIKVLRKFEEYNKAVHPALYITGNHDNWTFGHFEKLGFEVEPNYREFPLGSHRILIMHGDGQFGPRDDFMRPAFHRFLRFPVFTGVFQTVLPPALGLQTMKIFSSLTRRRNHTNPKPLNKHADRILRTHDIDLVMCGHDHIPRVETFSGGRYINLGTFFHHSTMVRYINDEFTLVRWDADNSDFIPHNAQQQSV